MDRDEDYYDDYMADQEPSFRARTDISPDELTSALHSLVLLRDDMYLGLQVTNLTVVDQFTMHLEHHTLQEYVRTDKTPPTTMFLNAQSQMWIFAAYELLRTWRARAKDIIKLANNGRLELKAASLVEDQGYLHAGQEMRAKQLREVAADPAIIETIEIDIRRQSRFGAFSVDIRGYEFVSGDCYPCDKTEMNQSKISCGQEFTRFGRHLDAISS